MRNFVISDIHGDNEAFRRALKHVKLKKTDNLILLGDFIDRGFDSKGVLDTIILLKEHGFNIICLRGNHEEMFLNAFNNNKEYDNWLLNGGDKTLLSFYTSSIDKIPQHYIDLISSFEYSYTYEQYILVHAALNMLIEHPFDDKQVLLWERDPYKYYNKEWLSNKVIIHGHTPVIDTEIINQIENKGPFICIDNGTYINKQGYGAICILELDNLTYNFIK